MPTRFGRMSFSVRPLCIDLISALLSLAWSRHILTLPFTSCTIPMSCQFLVGLFFVVSLGFLSGVPAIHIPLFYELPDTIDCHILRANRMYPSNRWYTSNLLYFVYEIYNYYHCFSTALHNCSSLGCLLPKLLDR